MTKEIVHNMAECDFTEQVGEWFRPADSPSEYCIFRCACGKTTLRGEEPAGRAPETTYELG